MTSEAGAEQSPVGRPTMDTVAERAGVSRALVSLVMRESPRVSQRSRAKVLAAASELGYRPNLQARSLARGRTDTVGVLVNDLNNPFFTEIAQAVADTASGHRLQVLLASGWGRTDGEAEALESLLNLRTDGLVLCGPRVPVETLIEYATRTPMAGISVFGSPANLDTVCNHESEGAQLAIDHLLSLGHERIAHIHAAPAAGGPERRRAFIDAMVKRGLAPILVEGDFTEEAGAEGAQQLLSLREPPTAILASNDLAAVGVLGRLAELGVQVPTDVSVVGYDDTLLASINAISLTTVHQPRETLGARALELLVERMNGRTQPSHELVEPRLVVRGTTGPRPG